MSTNILYKMRNKYLIFIFIGLFFCICAPISSLAQEPIVKEILIRVKPRIIELPENVEIERVPLGAARVRSTDLRKLNKQYKAMSIERVFEVRDKKSRLRTSDSSVQGKGRVLRSEDHFDLSSLLTPQARKKIAADVERQGREVVEKPGVFLIQLGFAPDDEINMAQIIRDYKAVDAVLNAEYITRKNR